MSGDFVRNAEIAAIWTERTTAKIVCHEEREAIPASSCGSGK